MSSDCARIGRVLPFLLFVTLFLVCPVAGQPPEQGVELQQVVTQIKTALRDAAPALKGGVLPPLKSVTVVLQTEVSKATGGTFKFLVFSFGTKYEKSRSQELSITLTPPETKPETVSKTPSLAEPLKDAILSAAAGVAASAAEEPRLEVGKFAATVNFVVQRTGTAGASFAILPVSAELSGNLSQKAIHNVVLVFEKPKKDEE
jgi:hypothetical protein